MKHSPDRFDQLKENASSAASSNHRVETRKALEQAQRVPMPVMLEYWFPDARKVGHTCRAVEIFEPLARRGAFPARRRGGNLCQALRSKGTANENKAPNRNRRLCLCQKAYYVGSAATTKRPLLLHSAANDDGPAPQSNIRAKLGTSDSAKNASYSAALRPQGGTAPPRSKSRDISFPV